MTWKGTASGFEKTVTVGVFVYLRLCAGRIHQVLAGHLNRLVGSGELRGIHQTLLTS